MRRHRNEVTVELRKVSLGFFISFGTSLCLKCSGVFARYFAIRFVV